jgi:hypothetical protein
MWKQNVDEWWHSIKLGMQPNGNGRGQEEQETTSTDNSNDIIAMIENRVPQFLVARRTSEAQRSATYTIEIPSYLSTRSTRPTRRWSIALVR